MRVMTTRRMHPSQKVHLIDEIRVVTEEIPRMTIDGSCKRESYLIHISATPDTDCHVASVLPS
jgi:hypothetical protein